MVYNQPGSQRPSQVLAQTGSPEVPDHHQDDDHHHCNDQDDSDGWWWVQGGFSLHLCSLALCVITLFVVCVD